MSALYRWKSELSADEVVENLIEYNDKKNNPDWWYFWHKPLDGGSIKFKLEYTHYFRRSPTYRVSYLKGTIRETEYGCVIEAEKHFTKENLAILLQIVSLFALAICVIIGDIIGLKDITIILPIIFFLIAAAEILWYLRTRKDALERDRHLLIVNSAAKAKYSRSAMV
ncbi:MAG: hypothetical protein LBN97_09775 [Oscillospiraceae bacterium]|nr:hypothetical protein [Oscillospiraceae bacterium]